MRLTFYEPKTRAGYRDLSLPDELVVILKSWKHQCPASEHDLVFCRTDGQPLRRGKVLGQGLHPALRRAKLRGGNIKTLRHSYASGLIAAGASITEVQHRLGHNSPAITLKVYVTGLRMPTRVRPIGLRRAFCDRPPPTQCPHWALRA